MHGRLTLAGYSGRIEAPVRGAVSAIVTETQTLKAPSWYRGSLRYSEVVLSSGGDTAEFSSPKSGPIEFHNGPKFYVDLSALARMTCGTLRFRDSTCISRRHALKKRPWFPAADCTDNHDQRKYRFALSHDADYSPDRRRTGAMSSAGTDPWGLSYVCRTGSHRHGGLCSSQRKRFCLQHSSRPWACSGERHATSRIDGGAFWSLNGLLAWSRRFHASLFAGDRHDGDQRYCGPMHAAGLRWWV